MKNEIIIGSVQEVQQRLDELEKHMPMLSQLAMTDNQICVIANYNPKHICTIWKSKLND